MADSGAIPVSPPYVRARGGRTGSRATTRHPLGRLAGGMKASDSIEALPDGHAWVRGDHSARRTIQLRPSDTALADRLRSGTGQRSSQFDRYLYQRGLAAECRDRATEGGLDACA